MIIIGTVYALGGYDATKENDNIAYYITAEKHDDGAWYVTEENVTRKATLDELVLILANQEA